MNIIQKIKSKTIGYKMPELYKRLNELIPKAQTLESIQNNYILEEIYDESDYEAKDSRVHELNVEYGAIQARHPNCKLIMIDFEGFNFDIPSNAKLPIEAITETFDVEKQLQFIEENIFQWDDKPIANVNILINGFDPYRFPTIARSKGKKGPLPGIWIYEWNGFIRCEDHDGCSGGVAWGYAIVENNKLVWNGKVPMPIVYNEETW